MKEIDIIDYLKLNRENGIAFLFMPPEVRQWCINNHSNYYIPFRKLTGDGGSAKWETLANIEKFEYSKVYCLEEDYDYQPEFKGYWEEFDIDECGKFMIPSQLNDCVACLYPWWNWTGFLSDNDDKYNAFGGWFYEQDKTWNLALQVQSVSSSLILYYNEQQKVAPVTPTRIRFWRYRE